MKATEIAKRYFHNAKALEAATASLKETEPTEEEVRAFVAGDEEYQELCSGRFSEGVEAALKSGSNPMSVWEEVMDEEEYSNIVENHPEWMSEIECKYADVEEEAYKGCALREATLEVNKALNKESLALWNEVQDLRAVSIKKFSEFLAELTRLDSNMAKTLKNQIWQNDQD